jgi:LysR family glycine cleavage system transcriptional activator
MSLSELPPLAALKSFSAFAEAGNVAQAGAALNVSHAAISQQLRLLERHMGVALLDRTGRALVLTTEGRKLADALSLGFGAITTAVQDLIGADADRPLHISTTPTFAASWLMPRLPGFRATHPDIDLMLDPSPQLVPLSPGGIDIALRYGSGDWPGLISEPLLQSAMIVVAAPKLLKGCRIDSPADLAQFPWLEELGTTESTNWLRSKGVADGIVRGTMQVPGNLLLDGARDGQGVAVIVRHFVQADLNAGRLVALFEEETSSGYHIVTRPDVLRPAARTFVRWLRKQNSLNSVKGT